MVSAEATQEIQLEDIVELREAVAAALPVEAPAAPASSTELGDADLLEDADDAPATVKAAAESVQQDAEDLVATRAFKSESAASRITTTITTSVMATLRVPSLTLAQAMSALERTHSIPRASRLTRLRARFGRLPAPIWASISAAVAALIVGSAALAATAGSADDTPSIEVRGAEREEPQSADKSLRRKYVTSEQLGRWSELPTVPAVPSAIVATAP